MEFSTYELSISKKCTDRQNSENSIRGSLIFIPAIAAFFSYGYTAYYLSESTLLSLLAGALAFIIIFLVDRSIVALGKPGKLSLGILGRIALSVVLSTLIAEQILIGVFQDSIKEKQATEIALQTTRIDNKYEFKIKNVNDEIIPLTKELNRLRDAFIAESDGTSGTGKRGAGPIYEIKKKAYEEFKTEYDLAVVRSDTQVNELIAQKDREIQQAKGTQATGIIGSLRTLHVLAEEEPIVKTAMWLIRIALILLELLPIMVKLSSRKDDVYQQIADSTDRNSVKVAEALNLQKLENTTLAQQNILMKENVELKLAGLDIELKSFAELAKIKVEAERNNTMYHLDEKNLAMKIEDPELSERLLSRLKSIFDDLNNSVQQA